MCRPGPAPTCLRRPRLPAPEPSCPPVVTGQHPQRLCARLTRRGPVRTWREGGLLPCSQNQGTEGRKEPPHPHRKLWQEKASPKVTCAPQGIHSPVSVSVSGLEGWGTQGQDVLPSSSRCRPEPAIRAGLRGRAAPRSGLQRQGPGPLPMGDPWGPPSRPQRQPSWPCPLLTAPTGPRRRQCLPSVLSGVWYLSVLTFKICVGYIRSV